MKINIDAPLKQNEILQLLQSSNNPVYEYLGHPNNRVTQLQFEVNSPDIEDLIGYTKNLIKSTEYGRSIALRVLEDGKFW